MLHESVQSLIREEQARQGDRFVEGDLEAYLIKLGEHAEILSDAAEGRCRGFVAFYCNDLATKQAFITSVLVDPRDRGRGVGRSLVSCVLELSKRRGFATCHLEVARNNEAARAMYLSMGFRAVGHRGHSDLLEIAL